MKKIILLLSTIILFFFGSCKKDVEPEISKVEIIEENIEKGWDYIKINVEYDYPVELETVTLYLSEKEDMSGAESYDCKVEGKKFSVEVKWLKDGCIYYYCYEYDNGYEKTIGEKNNIMTTSKPIVVTKNILNINNTSVTLNGSVTNNDEDNKITEIGFCWNMKQSPTVDGDHNSNGGMNGTGTFEFSYNLTSLQENVTYYVRAYANTSYGIIYGEEKNFKTVEVNYPSVTTKDIINITLTTATCGGNVTSDGDATVTERGVCWSTNPNPTIEDNKTNDGSGLGIYTSNIINLVSNTQYYVRAYATNSKGTSYGDEKSFVTLINEDLPTVTTSDVSDITINSATCGGNVTSDGNITVTERGVCWSTNPNPTIEDNKTNDGSGLGIYTSNIINLVPNTQYYVRAYATNSKGTSYGDEKSFITLDDPNETITVNGVSFTMVPVEGGTFQMGATSEQGSDAENNEYPVHSVTLSDYYIGETEVTQELWEAVMGSNPSQFSGYPQRPVEWVSWNDCQEFITKLNQLAGKNFRLPTEAEWEYAARGGNKSKGYKYSGGNTIGNVAWYTDNSGSRTHDVKTKQANELGIYDMSGNVWEWCQDWYDSYSSNSQTNPTGPSSGYLHVLRGGSWDSSARGCRVSYRGGDYPDYRFKYLGFRLVL